MDTSNVTIPKITPANQIKARLRVYSPDIFVSAVNEMLSTFISNIEDIEHLKNNKLSITRYCSGYTLSEIRALIKSLIAEYRANGYIIKYSVYYHEEAYIPPEYIFKIKRIRFKTPKVAMPDTPPTYKEAVKSRPGFIKRLMCGLN
jgi:hypothetical protein